MKRMSQLDGVGGVAIILMLLLHYFSCKSFPNPGVLHTIALAFLSLRCLKARLWKWSRDAFHESSVRQQTLPTRLR
jgi:hypothetical protein